MEINETFHACKGHFKIYFKVYCKSLKKKLEIRKLKKFNLEKGNFT